MSTGGFCDRVIRLWWTSIVLVVVSITSITSFVPTIVPISIPTRNRDGGTASTTTTATTLTTTIGTLCNQQRWFRASSSSSSSLFMTKKRHNHPRKKNHRDNNENNNSGDDDVVKRNNQNLSPGEAAVLFQKRTDVRIFLTQRAIQSFLFLLTSFRDPHTVRWLESNYELKNLEHYHGTGALNLTTWGSSWDTIFVDMVRNKPNDIVIIQINARERRHGPKNPYLQDRHVEVEIDIDPASLVSRMISVREQIAKEWESDLDTLVNANEMILASYYDIMETARDDEECIETNDDDGDTTCLSTEHLTAAYGGNGNNAASTDRDGSGFAPSPRSLAFDRNAMTMLSNSIVFDERASSPYRKGNFDLLLLLATQESIHRVLREYRDAGSDRKVSYEWLREFYTSRVATYFDGDQQEYGRADDFVEQLLLMSPSLKTLDDGTVELVDPMRIAEDVIRTRTQVGIDWKEIAQTIPYEHMDLRKLLLARQMGTLIVNKSSDEMGQSNDAQTTASSSSSASKFGQAGDFDIGAFD